MIRRLVVMMVPLAVLVILAGLPGCGRSADPWQGESGSPRVVVTIAPLYSFVRGVAGKNAAVKCLCTTTGPHHYATDTRDVALIEKADVVFSVGLELDERFTDCAGQAGEQKKPGVHQAGRGIARADAS